jgi:hypothetical protein
VCIALQRAQEVEKAEPKIAYYCRMYALEQVGAPGALLGAGPVWLPVPDGVGWWTAPSSDAVHTPPSAPSAHPSIPPVSAVQGLEIKSGRAPEITGLLQALMGKLEKDKAVLQVGGRGAPVRGHSQWCC